MLRAWRAPQLVGEQSQRAVLFSPKASLGRPVLLAWAFAHWRWAAGWPGRGQCPVQLLAPEAPQAPEVPRGRQATAVRALPTARVLVPSAVQTQCLFLRAYRAQTAASAGPSGRPAPRWPGPISSSAIDSRRRGWGPLQWAMRPWRQKLPPTFAHARGRRRAHAHQGGRRLARWLPGTGGPVHRPAWSCKLLQMLAKAGPRIAQAALSSFKIHPGGLGNLLHAQVAFGLQQKRFALLQG